MTSAFPTLTAPETIDAICLDMDGVLADLYGYEGWEELLSTNQSEPYSKAQPLVNTSVLNDYIAAFWEDLGIPTYIVSWSTIRCEANYWFFDVQVERSKKIWLYKHLPAISDSNVFVTPYGVDKSSLVADLCSNPLLFDDSAENCTSWWWSNTVKVDPSSSNETVISTLSDLYDCLAAQRKF